MSANSKIEWCDSTWNPVLGCDKVSAGCRGCYAIPVAWQKQHNPNEKVRAAYEGLVERRPDGSLNWTGRVNFIPERFDQPLRWKNPRRIFVNSLSDLFHEQVPDEAIDRIFGVMALAPRHTFQVLTKRPERMAAYAANPGRQAAVQTAALNAEPDFRRRGGLYEPQKWLFRSPPRFGDMPWPLPNVWLGTSTEDQRAADERIPHLLNTPAAVRFLSCEPLLGPVDLTCRRMVGHCDSCTRLVHLPSGATIDWIITGGESGPGARPMNPAWAVSLRDQCQAAGVAFFHKQNGGRTANASGRLLDGREWSEFPAPAQPLPGFEGAGL